MNFTNGFWLGEKIYLTNNKLELHILISNPKKNGPKVGYFTIIANNIILK